MVSEFEKSLDILAVTLNSIYDEAVRKSGDPENPIGVIKKDHMPTFLQSRRDMCNLLVENFGIDKGKKMATGYILSQVFSMRESFGIEYPDTSEFSMTANLIALELQARDKQPGNIWDNWDQISQASQEVLSALMLNTFRAGRYSAIDMEPFLEHTKGFPTAIKTILLEEIKKENPIQPEIQSQLTPQPQ